MSTQAQRANKRTITASVVSLVAGIMVGTYASGNVPAILNAATGMLVRLAIICVVLWIARTVIAGVIVGVRQARKDRENV